jgi:uncharacterized protein DUF4105
MQIHSGIAFAAAALGCAFSGLRLHAQQPERGAELTIALVTMGPGQEVWERFGHNAIWVHDTLRHRDVQYNYGLFSFRQKNFILRFAQGKMLYSMGGFDATASMADYAAHNRSVWVQELALTPAQRADLRDFLEWNARPENAQYHYNYYTDNCSTRVRDAIDRVIGGRIRSTTDTVPSGTTFRWHTRRLTTTEPLIYTGLMLGLGEPVDRPISNYEETFLPLALREHVRSVQVPGPDGTLIPLVKSERTVYLSSEPSPPTVPPSWFPAYLTIGVLVGGVLWLLGRSAAVNAFARAAFAMLGGLWGLVAGLSGLMLAALWLLTDHVTSYANENLFQLNPVALPLALMLPLAVLSARRAPRAALRLAGIVVLLAAAGIVFKFVPGLRQVNGMLIALILPIHLGLWLGLRDFARAAIDRPRASAPAASGSPTA